MMKNKRFVMRLALILTISLIMNQTYIVNASEEILLADVVSDGELLADDLSDEELISEIIANESVKKTGSESDKDEIISESKTDTKEILADKEPSLSGDDIASGKYENVTWVIDKDGKLTVEGTGEYKEDDSLVTTGPWYAYRDQIVSAEISLTGTKNLSCLLYGCKNLTYVNLTGLDTSDTTNMRYMFYECSSLTTLDVSGFDTSNTTDMCGMFGLCSSLTKLDVSGLDTSKVTDMGEMFYGCSSLTTLDVSDFDTSKVTRMSMMFFECSSLTKLDVSGLDTSNVTYMGGMFGFCRLLTALDVSDFDTSNVIEMADMFIQCSSLTTLDLSGFRTSNVTDMSSMFDGCNSMKSLDVSKFDTSNVTNMGEMFFTCSSLTTLDVSGFDTSKVTNMHKMFIGCDSLEVLDVSKFNTSKVTDMGGMIADCENLKSLDLSSFDMSNVNEKNYLSFSGSTSLNSIKAPQNLKYDLELPGSGWINADTKEAVSVIAAGTAGGTEFIRKKTIKVTGITVYPETKELYLNKKFTISANVLPEDADNKEIVWKTDNAEIASVDNEGNVTAKALGEAKISAVTVDSGFSGTCKIIVIEDPGVAKSIEVTPSDIKINIGRSYKLTATVKPETALDKTVTWKSDNVKVAKVANDGTVTGVSVGKAVVTAQTSNGLSANSLVTVEAIRVTGVNIDKEDASIIVGDSLQLAANVLPADATDKSVTWTSDKPEIAAVDNKGNVTGMEVGTATITVKTNDGEFSTSCRVSVVKKTIRVTGVSIEPSSMELDIGDTYQLSAVIVPKDADVKDVKWSSDSPDIATVDETGKVTAKSAGTSIIWATTVDGNHTATFHAKVRNAIEVQSIEVAPSSLSIYIGQTYKLTATVSPSTANDKTITWSSNNEKVATVTADGTVTGVGVGEAVVTAVTSNGVSETCTVTVEKMSERVEGVTITPKTTTIEVNDSLYLRAEVFPADADDKNVAYRMGADSEGIISLGNDGKVTGLSEGTATVAVVTNDGGYEDECTIYVIKEETLPDNDQGETRKVDNTGTDVNNKEEIGFAVDGQDGKLNLRVEDTKAPGLRAQIGNDSVFKTYPRSRYFDIYLENEYKQRIQNFGICTIWIPLDPDMDPSDGIAVVTTGEDGEPESLPAKAVMKDGVMFAKFKTTHFTYFAILCGDFIHDTLNEDTTPNRDNSSTTTKNSSSGVSASGSDSSSSSTAARRSSSSSSTTDILKVVTQSSSNTPAYGSANSAGAAASSKDDSGSKTGSKGGSKTKDSIPKTGDRKWQE